MTEKLNPKESIGEASKSSKVRNMNLGTKIKNAKYQMKFQG
jgi:hypothetical protein